MAKCGTNNFNRYRFMMIAKLFFSIVILLNFSFITAAPQKPELEFLNSKTYKMKHGDSLERILSFHRVPKKLVRSSLSKSIMGKEFRFLKKHNYLVMSAPGKKLFRFYCPYTTHVYDLNIGKSEIKWSKAEANLDVEVVYVEGKVRGSLMASITKKIPSDLIALRFMDAYLLDYRLPRGIQRGANYAFHLEKQYDQGHFIRYGEVLNTSLEIRGKVVDRDFVRYPGGGSFVDSNYIGSDKKIFYSPVYYGKISSTYRPRRFHPIKKRYIAHLGLDYALPEGEPIIAPLKGKVVKHGRTRGAGRYVVLDHNNGFKTYYNHMSKIEPNIKKGLVLKAGTKLGEIGCTGYCTMPHLHYAIKKRGRFVDPAKYTRSFPYSYRHLFYIPEIEAPQSVSR
ncbi:MAG: M23 family metallopeptidase [Bdellovibrionales bacterium]